MRIISHPTKLYFRSDDKKGMNHHRRKKQRNLCSDLLLVSWIEDDGRTRNEMAALEDISIAGACLHLDRFLPAGTTVSLYYPEGKYVAKVKYCQSQHIGFLAGLAFEPGYRWSPLDFQPSHLMIQRELPSLALLLN